MNGVLDHDSAQGYTGPETTWEHIDMNLIFPVNTSLSLFVALMESRDLSSIFS